MNFNVTDLKIVGSSEIQLNELDRQEEYDRVTVTVTVVIGRMTLKTLDRGN